VGDVPASPTYTFRIRAIVLIGLASLLLAGSAAAAPPRLAAVHTWAFAIGDGTLSGDIAQRYAGYDLVVVDGQEVTKRQVATLHDGGALVLGYLDAGTIEPYRPWYRRAKPYRLDYWKQWGEWYANVDAPGYRKLLRGVARGFERKGLDGLFLDNTDMVETHPKQKPGMRRLVASLAQLVHRRGGFLFAQNGADVVRPILRYLDGWNREDVGTDSSAVRDLRAMHARGLLTLATGYVKNASSPAVKRDIRIACRAGALPFVSNLALTRVPHPQAHC
jgi:endo-alpha-1,4-polygalactosaminidase (GH114 family)